MTFGSEEAPRRLQEDLNPHPLPEQLAIREKRARIAKYMHTLLPKPAQPPANSLLSRAVNGPAMVESPKVYMPNEETKDSAFGWYWLARSSAKTAPDVSLYFQPADVSTPRKTVRDLSIPIVAHDNDVAFGWARFPAQDETDYSISSQAQRLDHTVDVLNMIHRVAVWDKTTRPLDIQEASVTYLPQLELQQQAS